jgi:hypothetical protein
MSKKLMAILVLMVLGITVPIAADAVQPQVKGTKSGPSYAVYVEIPVGDHFDEVTIAEFGPLELFARCFLSDGTGPAGRHHPTPCPYFSFSGRLLQRVNAS